jgi:cobalt/nickel transport system permease protein
VHHPVLDRWSRRDSPLHHRDARGKLICLLMYLVALATARPLRAETALFFAGMLAATLLVSRLPLGGVLRRAALVLPFAASFALILLWLGDRGRALELVSKSFLSAAAVLWLVGSTPLPSLLNALRKLGVPRLQVDVAQFLYRYLFVLAESAQHMRLAAAARGGRSRLRFQAAGGAVAALFAAAHAHAAGIQRAMLARGFSGRWPEPDAGPFSWKDWGTLLLCGALCGGARLL